MGYTSKIPPTNTALDFLENSIPSTDRNKIMAAFSMTGMTEEEVMDLINTNLAKMIYMNRAYSEIKHWWATFLDQFTTENNDYYTNAKRILKTLAPFLENYRQTLMAFLPDAKWHYKAKSRRVKRNLYTSSTLCNKAPICNDMFYDKYPPIVSELIDVIIQLIERFQECTKIVNHVNEIVDRRKREGDAALKCWTQYRQNTIDMYEEARKRFGINEDTYPSMVGNRLYETRHQFKNELEFAQQWYHNCTTTDANNYIIYTYLTNQSDIDVPISFLAENIDAVCKNYTESYMIAELYSHFGDGMTLSAFCSEYAAARKLIGKECVGYGAVDKVRHKQHRYTDATNTLIKKYQQTIQDTVSLSSVSQTTTQMPYFTS